MAIYTILSGAKVAQRVAEVNSASPERCQKLLAGDGRAQRRRREISVELHQKNHSQAPSGAASLGHGQLIHKSTSLSYWSGDTWSMANATFCELARSRPGR